VPTIEKPARSEADVPFRAAPEGLYVALRVQPKGSQDRIEGLSRRADGTVAIKLRVGAPPADGKANAAVIKLLAKTWGLAKSDLEIVSGGASRDKVLRIAGDGPALLRKLNVWLAQQGVT
jgi:uncharacterized protein (TIGR00251 family)